MSKKLTAERVNRIVQALPSLYDGRDVADNTCAFFGCSLESLLLDYFRVMELSHFIRRGGVKAMIYRLETGKTALQDVDYFDDAHNQLSQRYQNLLPRPEPMSKSCLLEELKEVSAEEEALVQQALPALDQLLLLPKRQEAVQLDETC